MSKTASSHEGPGFAVTLACTFLRIPLAVTFSIVFLNVQSATVRLVVGLVLVGIVEASDILDGLLARKLKVVTEWGAMLDPYSDSISRIIIFWTLAIAGIISPVVPLVMALRDITVSYCRVLLARRNLTVAAKLSGKVKAVVQGAVAMIIIGALIYQDVTGDPTAGFCRLLGWVVVVVTAVSAIEYIKSAVTSRSESA